MLWESFRKVNTIQALKREKIEQQRTAQARNEEMEYLIKLFKTTLNYGHIHRKHCILINYWSNEQEKRCQYGFVLFSDLKNKEEYSWTFIPKKDKLVE